MGFVSYLFYLTCGKALAGLLMIPYYKSLWCIISNFTPLGWCSRVVPLFESSPIFFKLVNYPTFLAPLCLYSPILDTRHGADHSPRLIGAHVHVVIVGLNKNATRIANFDQFQVIGRSPIDDSRQREKNIWISPLHPLASAQLWDI